MTPPTHELEAYFAGDCTDEQLRAVEDWLHADPAHAKQFMDELRFREMVGERIRERNNDSAAIIAELARLEAAAHPAPVSLDDDRDPPTPDASTADPLPPLSGREALSAVAYLAGKLVTVKSASLAAAAAVILLAGVLLIPWGTGQPDPAPATGQAPTDQTRPGATPAARPVVARLTDTHDAVWAHDAPATGSQLHPGDRLRLTAGFAEVTTARGAVVILHAPADVQMLDNDNALYLSAGKLVGVVEQGSAQGFWVRTRQADITDLGTRFGVASRDGATHVRVFEGEVVATAQNAGAAATPMRLTADQAAEVEPGGRTIRRVDPSADRFVTHWRALAQAPAITGEARYEPSVPDDLRVNAYEHNAIQIFAERTGLALTGPVTVNIIDPGTYANQDLLSPIVLPAGARVDTYLIHVDTPEAEGAARAKTATVRFERPILGLITSGQTMARSHAALGLAGVRYGTASAGGNPAFTGLDLSGNAPESVTLSDDRRTLTLHLSTGNGIDQARVLVAGEDEP